MKDGPVPKVEPEHKIAATHLETNKIEEEKKRPQKTFLLILILCFPWLEA